MEDSIDRRLTLDELEMVIGGTDIAADVRITEFERIWKQKNYNELPDMTKHTHDQILDEFLRSGKSAEEFLKNIRI
ncbi:MAG: hypothetical protein K6B28_10450 [Lachnospiraceae bacterium]|nr:hypothetical protein [Lachnospiraceae bacterium]